MNCSGCWRNAEEGTWRCQRVRLHDGPCWHWAGGIWHVWGLTPWRHEARGVETPG